MIAIIHYKLRSYLLQPGNALQLALYVLIMVFIAAIAGATSDASLWITLWLGIVVISQGLVRDLYERDAATGLLTQFMMAPTSAIPLFIAYWFAHAALFFVYTVLLYSMITLLLGQMPVTFMAICAALLVITLINAMVALLTCSSLRASILAVILLFPFYLPVIIFTTAAEQSGSHALLLIGFFLFLMPIFVWLASKLLQIVIEEG